MRRMRVVLLALTVLGGTMAWAPVAAAARPRNDSFEKAVPLAPPATARGFTDGATMQRGEPLGCVRRNSVWYSFTSEQPMPVVIDLLSERYPFSVAALYTGTSLRSLRHMACVTDYEPASFLIEPGITYYLQLGRAVAASPGAHLVSAGLGWSAAAPEAFTAAHAYTAGEGYDVAASAPLVGARSGISRKGQEGGAIACVVPLVLLCVGGGAGYRLGDGGAVAGCWLAVAVADCASARAPSIVDHPVPGTAGVMSVVALNELRSGPLVVSVHASHFVGMPQVCVGASRSSVRGTTKTVDSESSCERSDSYRFDPVWWRAATKVALPSVLVRETYRLQDGEWRFVSSTSRNATAALDLSWTGRGDASPVYSVHQPFIGVCYWPPGCVVPPYVETRLVREAGVAGSLRFGGLGATVRLPRSARGTMTWVIT